MPELAAGLARMRHSHQENREDVAELGLPRTQARNCRREELVGNLRGSARSRTQSTDFART
jgi:hypothetical protein